MFGLYTFLSAALFLGRPVAHLAAYRIEIMRFYEIWSSILPIALWINVLSEELHTFLRHTVLSSLQNWLFKSQNMQYIPVPKGIPKVFHGTYNIYPLLHVIWLGWKLFVEFLCWSSLSTAGQKITWPTSNALITDSNREQVKIWISCWAMFIFNLSH